MKYFFLGFEKKASPKKMEKAIEEIADIPVDASVLKPTAIGAGVGALGGGALGSPGGAAGAAAGGIIGSLYGGGAGLSLGLTKKKLQKKTKSDAQKILAMEPESRRELLRAKHKEFKPMAEAAKFLREEFTDARNQAQWERADAAEELLYNKTPDNPLDRMLLEKVYKAKF